MLAHPGHVLLHRDVAESVDPDVVHLFRVVRQQSERPISSQKVEHQGGRVREVTRIVGQPERAVRLVRALPSVLQDIRRRLGPEPDPPPFVPRHVDNHPTGLGDAPKGARELGAAVAAQRSEDVAGKAVRVHPHEGLGVIGEIAEDEHAVHRYVGDEAREAPHRTPLAKGAGELVHRLELGVAHDRVPVGMQVFPADVKRERDRPEDIEGATPGGNRVRQIDSPSVPINPDELALVDEARVDGRVDIGKHRSSATRGERARRAHGACTACHLGPR